MQHGLDATWELLQSGATNDEQLSALQEIWLNGAIVPDLAKHSEAYRAWNLERLEAQTWEAFHYNNNASDTTDRLELQGVSPLGAALWYLAGRYFDEYGVLVFSQEGLRRERTAAQTRRWDSFQKESGVVLPWLGPWPPVMLFSSEWSYPGHMLRLFEFETQREMTVAAIALQRFRLRHGRWPEKLEDLVPEFLPVLPRDWMDGQPLRYRRNANDTFTLYSVGEDLRDDGGDPSPVPVKRFDKSPMWMGRDAVWPCVATDENVAALKRAAVAKGKHHSDGR